MPVTSHSQIEAASTPNIDDTETVGPVPFDLRTGEFDETENSPLTSDSASAILTELWRLTRNQRLLEIEQEVRGHMVSDLELSLIACRNTENGVLDPTAAAREFAETVRDTYPQHLVTGPEPTWATHATATGDHVEPLQVK